MFEVEQKFLLSEKEKKLLLDGAEFLGEKVFTDKYFDDLNFSLTKNDIWLRKRGEIFELKIPIAGSENSSTNQYQEIEGGEKIREIFAITPIKSFIEDIKDLGYDSFCQCTTVRKKYKRESFVIDLDEVEYEADNFKYQIAEIELLVENKEKIKKAENEIIEFSKKIGLKISPVRGKVLEFLRNKKPDHYQALVDAGVVKGDFVSEFS